MDKIKEFFSRMLNNGLGHWYTHTWLIAVLFLLWPLVFPPIIGLVLITIQNATVRQNFELLQNQEDFKKYVEDNTLELYKKEDNMLDEVTKRTKLLLFNQHEADVQWCKELKQSTIEKCDKLKENCQIECEQLKLETQQFCDSLKENTSTACANLKLEAETYRTSVITEAQIIKSEADGYQQSVYNRCGALKEQTESDCKKMRLDAEKDSDRIKYQWEKIRIFTDSHYKKIQCETDDWMRRVDNMSNGHDFERFFADLLRLANYDHVEVTKGSGDKGADVLAAKDGIKYAIQCKRYNQRVDTSAVQEATSGKMFYECHVAIVATNRGFTNSAIELATKTGVILWDRKALRRMVFDYCRTMYIRAFDIENYTE